MDTKLKKSKLYSIQAKVTAIVLIFIFLITGYIGIVGFLKLEIDYDSSPMQYSNYFETRDFSENVNNLINQVINVNLIYKSEEDIKNGKAISEDEYIRSLANEYGIDLDRVDFNFNGFSSSDKAKSEGYEAIIKNYATPSYALNTYAEADTGEYNEVAELTEEEKYKYDEFIKMLDEEYPTYKKELIQQQLYDYKYALENILSYVNFKYYIEDEKGKQFASNATLEDVKANKALVIIDGPYISGMDSLYYNNNATDVLGNLNYKLYASVNDKLIPGDYFYTTQINFNNSKGIVPILLICVIVSFVLIFLLSIYLIIVAGRNEKHGDIKYLGVDKIYTDIHTLLLMLFAILSIVLADILVKETRYATSGIAYICFVIVGFILMIDIFTAINYFCSMSRQIKGKCIFKNTLCSNFIRRVGSLFSGKTFKGWIVLLMILYGVCNIILMFFTFAVFSPTIIVLIAFNIFALYLFVRALTSLTKIMIAARETSIGNINYEIDISRISPSFINFASDVANIQRGLKNAVSEAVKGERMKVDLITNVSHDLKTPLTSIVTYVDLLKKENLNNETAQKYVDILDEKSGRLKQLIEDLIEASKASSGNLSVTHEKVDLRQLVMQASGEFEEKIQNSQLNIIISSESGITVSADGKHMWRIVENLLSNTIKYSMPNSRVYIDILKTETKGVLIIKNMSAQPIEVTSDQLMERFVRGDVSRTTEGSGLGLSIAQSLTTLQGGELKISIDGDLFKVCVIMPMWENTDEDDREIVLTECKD